MTHPSVSGVSSGARSPRGTCRSAVARWLVAGALLAVCPGHALALDGGKPLVQLVQDHWTTAQGLPQDSVQAILQTRDGYVWLATQEGLVRFDGIRFAVFDRQNTPAIAHNNIQSLCETRDGALWVGTNRGLVRYAQGQFRGFLKADGLANENVQVLVETRDGSLLIGTWGGGLLRYRDGQFAAFPSPGVTLANGFVQAIHQAADGRSGLAPTVGCSGCAAVASSWWVPRIIPAPACTPSRRRQTVRSGSAPRTACGVCRATR